MAIKPSSDIVLEVLKAADPLRAQATTQKLTALSTGSADAADDFAKALDAAGPPAAESPVIAVNASDMRARLAAAGLDAAKDQKAARVQLEFEASILKTFVDAILPKNEADVYGQGTAGDIWKSMLADQIAKQIAKSGAFGISKRLFSTHPLPGHEHLAGLSPGASSPLTDAALGGVAKMGNPATLMSSDSVFHPGAFLSTANNRS